MRHNISVRVATFEVIFEACAALRRGSWRSVLRICIRTFKSRSCGVQRLNQCIDTRRFEGGQTHFGTLQSADCCGADTGGFAQLRLRDSRDVRRSASVRSFSGMGIRVSMGTSSAAATRARVSTCGVPRPASQLPSALRLTDAIRARSLRVSLRSVLARINAAGSKPLRIRRVTVVMESA